jgi:hypothetical protein
MTTKGADTAATPRWVKVSAIIVLLLVVLVVVMLVTAPGGHGPSRHALGGATPWANTGTDVTRQRPSA